MVIEINNTIRIEESELIAALERAGYKVETHFSVKGCFSFKDPEPYLKKICYSC